MFATILQQDKVFQGSRHTRASANVEVIESKSPKEIK
jgi:hypothetical protein